MDHQTAKYYDENAENAVSVWEQISGAESYFGVAFPAGARVLHIGSGSGRDLANLLRHGWDSYGLEPSCALRHQSVQLHPELKNRVSAGALPANMPTDGEFDGVLWPGVLQVSAEPAYAGHTRSAARASDCGPMTDD